MISRLVIPLICLACLVISPGAAARTPAIRIVDESPVTVAGSGFAARERLTVRFSLVRGDSWVKIVRATAAGRFVATFTGHSVPDCGDYRVAVVGGGGSRATLRRIDPPPPCGYEPIP